MQVVVMILAAFLLFSGTVAAAGGLQSFFSVRNQPGGAELFMWNGGVAFPVLLGVLFAGTLKFIVEPRQLSRFYALEGKGAIKTGAWVSTLSFAVVYAMLVPIGIYARRIFPDGITDSDQVVPQLLTSPEVFSSGVSAFLLLSMVAAAMSSLDSVLLVMASTAERDIVGVLRNATEKHAVRNTRLYVALFAFITMLIAFNPPGGIVALTALSGATYAACFLPSMILGLYWRKGNGQAVVASFIGGLSVLLFWRYLPVGQSIHQVFPAVLISVLLYLGFSLGLSNPESEMVRRLFSQIANEDKLT